MGYVSNEGGVAVVNGVRYNDAWLSREDIQLPGSEMFHKERTMLVPFGGKGELGLSIIFGTLNYCDNEFAGMPDRGREGFTLRPYKEWTERPPNAEIALMTPSGIYEGNVFGYIMAEEIEAIIKACRRRTDWSYQVSTFVTMVHNARARAW